MTLVRRDQSDQVKTNEATHAEASKNVNVLYLLIATCFICILQVKVENKAWKVDVSSTCFLFSLNGVSVFSCTCERKGSNKAYVWCSSILICSVSSVYWLFFWLFCLCCLYMDGSSDMSRVPVATEVNLKTFKLLSCFLLLNLRFNSLFLVV